MSTRILQHFEELGRWSVFASQAFLAVVRIVATPQFWLRPLYSCLVGALPLAVVAGLAIGVVIGIHTRGVLARSGSGAVDLLPTFLGAAVLLELGPIAAGLIVAARTGASLGAELASLRTTEQLDALQLLGVSPMVRLIGPRVLACLLATPMLHVLIATLALGGGYVAEAMIGHTTWLKYQIAVLAELRVEQVVLSGLKTVVFGGLVGVTGCYLGHQAEMGSEGVGRAATMSVVVCSLLVLGSDVILVSVIQLLTAPV